MARLHNRIDTAHANVQQRIDGAPVLTVQDTVTRLHADRPGQPTAQRLTTHYLIVSIQRPEINRMKGRMLQVLRKQGGCVPADTLSRELDVSRASIAKHVRDLQENGYVIESSPPGYRLVSSPDLLLPYEVPGFEKRIHYFPEIGSTMDEARKLARRGAQAGTIVIAEIQTGGRGRLNREWVSPRGGIYCTVILRPEVTPTYAPLANLMASVAVANTIRKLYGLNAEVKWPNDVLIAGRKVCGILAEMESGMEVVRFINVGIGLNANTAVPEFAETATSLKEALRRDICRQEFLGALIMEIERRQDSLTDANILQEWRDLSVTLDTNVRITAANEIISGRAVDIDDTGSLTIMQIDGSLRKIVAGDCSQ